MRQRRRILYLLPNLFTFSSVFCGLLSIRWSLTGDEPVHFYSAAIAILFAAVFDLVDGRVARLTHTESRIGVQLDSLADVISFGVAPAMLVYAWGLQGIMLGGLDIGFILSFSFVAAGAFRLARFNVVAERGADEHAVPSSFFVGLPIPLAACLLAALVFAHHQTEAALFQRRLLLLLLVPLLAWLMVSRVRYRTFKRLHVSRQGVLLGVSLLCLAALVTVRTAPAVTIVVALVLYIGAGLVSHLVTVPRRRRERRLARRHAAGLVEEAVELDDELLDGESEAVDENE